MSPWKNDCVTQDDTAGLTTQGMVVQVATTGANVTATLANTNGNGAPGKLPDLLGDSTNPFYSVTITLTAPDPSNTVNAGRCPPAGHAFQNNGLGDQQRRRQTRRTVPGHRPAEHRLPEQDRRRLPADLLGEGVPRHERSRPRCWSSTWASGRPAWGPGYASITITPRRTPRATPAASRSGSRGRPRGPPRPTTRCWGWVRTCRPGAKAAQQPFKAFARIGELDRVLCRACPLADQDETNFWGTAPASGTRQPATRRPAVARAHCQRRLDERTRRIHRRRPPLFQHAKPPPISSGTTSSTGRPWCPTSNFG